jgi:outer membrane receptor protein involved in Fe transport
VGCADPAAPCRLPNALAGDPPLDQVVTRTWEAGVRGMVAGANWSAGWFRADNRDDILFVSSTQTGFGYFRNFGETRRQGIELGLHGQTGRMTIGGSYAFLDATFQSEETVNGAGNSSNDEAEEGLPGLDGTIGIERGDRIPLVPRHVAKAFAGIQVSGALSVDLQFVGISSAFARGNENNEHEPDGLYYLGEGHSAPYGVVNLGARYALTPGWQVVLQIQNLLDRRYETAAQLGPTGLTADGAFVARPFPAVDGEFPLRSATFYAPGAPRLMWAGLRVTF